MIFILISFVDDFGRRHEKYVQPKKRESSFLKFKVKKNKTEKSYIFIGCTNIRKAKDCPQVAIN